MTRMEAVAEAARRNAAKSEGPDWMMDYAYDPIDPENGYVVVQFADGGYPTPFRLTASDIRKKEIEASMAVKRAARNKHRIYDTEGTLMFLCFAFAVIILVLGYAWPF